MTNKNIFSVCLICFFWLNIFSQNRTIDSLLKLGNNHKHDTIGTKSYYKISTIYFGRGLVDSGYVYAKKGYHISKKLNYVRGIAAAYGFFGQVYNYTGDKDSAIYYFSKAKELYSALKDSAKIAGMYNNIGVVLYKHGNISKALEYYFRALKIKEKLGDSLGIGNSYSNIGNLYSEAGDSSNAIKYHKWALGIRKKINDLSGLGISNMAVGVFYQKAGKLNEALPYLKEGLLIGEKLGDEEAISIGCYNLANNYYRLKEVEKSIALYHRSLEISKKNKNYEGIASCLSILGEIMFEKKDAKSAIKLLEEAYSVSEIIDNKVLKSNISDNLSSAYESIGEYKSSLFYRKLWITTKDSLFSIENTRKLTSEGIKYEHEKEKIIREKEQEKKEAVAKSEAFKKDLILGTSLLFLLVVLFFTFLIFKRLKENRKQKSIIEQQRNEMVDSINYAKRIQFALLAHTDLLKENLPEHFVFFQPKDIVSGDFYWATKTKDFFYLAVCDSTGHGVPGAFMSLLNISFLNEAINEKNISAPNEVLNHVRKRLLQNMDGGHDGMDAVLLKIPINNSISKIEYAAANNSPIVIRNNEILELPKDKMPVGKGENTNSFKLQTIDLCKGDSIFLYTDGFADQFGGPKGKKFKYKQLNQILLSNVNATMDDQKESLNSSIQKWMGNLEQVDDICVIGIKI